MINPQIVQRDNKGRFINGWLRKYPIQKICKYCGNEFNINNSKEKNKIYCNVKCRGNDRKGKKYLEETKNKISLSNIGKHNRPHTEEEKLKIGLSGIGRIWTIERRLKFSKERKGNWSHLWKGGISKHHKEKYYSIEYKIWREQVFKRDEFTCQKCGKNKIYLTAHHIKSWVKYPELRFDINNGITLCEDCHKLTDNYKGKEHKQNVCKIPLHYN